MNGKFGKLGRYFVLLLVCLVTCIGLLPQKAVAANDALARVKAAGVLRVGTSADNPPNEFIKMVDGKEQIVGYDIDIAQYIADKIGVKLELTNMNFDGLIPSLQNNDFDFSISGFTPSEERRKVVDFSKSYFELPIIVMVKKENADKYTTIESLDGKEVGALRGSTQDAAIETYLPNAKRTPSTKVPDVIAQLNAGNIEAAVLELPVAETYMKAYPDLVVANIDLGVPEDETAQVIAFPKGSETLVTEVNTIIDELADNGKLDEFLTKNKALAEEDQSGLGQYAGYFARGALTTILVALVCVILGTLLGIFVAMFRISKNKIISSIAYLYVQILRGTPALLQVFIFYFGLTAIFKFPEISFMGINVARLIPGCVALSINSSAYVAEIIRSGINAVDKGQMEAGYSLGLNAKTTMKEIILPQAVKNILPALGNEFASMIKETSLLSVIAVSELMFVADTVKAATYNWLPPMLIAGAIYFVITFSVSLCVSLVEKKLAKSTKM